MKTLLLSFILVVPLVGNAQDTVPPSVLHRAAQFVAHTHDAMLDPASFVVDNVIVAENRVYESRGWRGRGKQIGVSYNVCVYYRSHNRMGGYSADVATLEATKDESDLYQVSDSQHLGVASFDVARSPNSVCKKPIADITAQVLPLAKPLFTKTQ